MPKAGKATPKRPVERGLPAEPRPPVVPPAVPPAPKLRPLHLKVDPERFPELPKHPGLERALLIRQAMEKGLAREQAVAAAELTMGKRAPRMGSAPAGRPQGGKRPRSAKGKIHGAHPMAKAPRH